MRAIIAATGTGAAEFLQGLVTTDTRRLAEEGIQWSALLSPQGKYLADFFLVQQPDGVWVDVAATQADDLLRRLTLYRLRAPIGLERLEMPVARGTGAPPPGALPDPRHPALGWRRYGVAGDDGSDWDAIRVAHVIPEAGRELLANETYPLEAGFERLGGVDFRKGCYVGQEVTARMKHKAVLRKGLMQVGVTGRAPEGTAILGADGREVGTLFTQSGGRGIAQMRFDRIGPGMTAGEAAVDAVAPE